MDGILPTDIQALQTALETLGQVFIEVIIVNGANFVLITQFDVFLSDQPALDDCAYPVQANVLPIFHAELKQKTRFKTSWNELIIQNGRHQILVTGGLFGTYNSNHIQPFLGSSFPFSFSGDASSCYVNRNDAQLKIQQRYLIDYKKSSSNLLAGFISRRFSLLGFEAAHPFHYGNAAPVGPQPQPSHVSSRILCHYSMNHCTSEDAVDILHSFLRTNTMVKLLKGRQITKYSNLSILLNQKMSNLIRAIINKLIKMESITNSTSPARISSLDHEDEPDGTKLRDLVNNGLASNIKNINKVIVKKFIDSNIEN